jgi:hypothetical protein
MLALGICVAVLGTNIIAGGDPVYGQQEPTADPCAPQPTVEIDSFGDTVPIDCVPGGGPDLTPDPTNTAVPQPTEPPAPPPTATQPAGGAGAGGVAPPNTGDGGSITSGANLALIVAGLLLTVGGGSLVAVGARRRR